MRCHTVQIFFITLILQIVSTIDINAKRKLLIPIFFYFVFLIHQIYLHLIQSVIIRQIGELLKLNPDIHNNQLDEGRIINVPVSKVVLNGDPNRNALDQEDSDEVLVLAAEDKNAQGSSDPDGKAH